MSNNRPDYAAEIRRSLTDPLVACDRLGLTKGATKSAAGVMICCPAHGDRTPSCSVTRGRDGTIRFKCHGCQATGDLLTLVAIVHDLDLRTDFRAVLLEAATLGGLHHVVAELNDRKPYEPRALPPLPEPEPERDYPPLPEVEALWGLAGSVAADPVAGGHLVGRGLDARLVESLGLARAIPAGATVPTWARYRGKAWSDSGHRLLVPVVDAKGDVRSVRSWRVEGDAAAKRLPPSGHKATGLALANGRARALLRAPASPKQIVVVEGEPDFLSAAITWPTRPILGVLSGTWSEEFAARIPTGSEVIVMTHNDRAGDRYAEQIIGTIKTRAVVRRTEAA